MSKTPQSKLKKYDVELDIVFLEGFYEIEARSKKEAIKIAKTESNNRGHIADVFSVELSDKE